jgi:hypothetical protein
MHELARVYVLSSVERNATTQALGRRRVQDEQHAFALRSSPADVVPCNKSIRMASGQRLRSTKAGGKCDLIHPKPPQPPSEVVGPGRCCSKAATLHHENTPRAKTHPEVASGAGSCYGSCSTLPATSLSHSPASAASKHTAPLLHCLGMYCCAHHWKRPAPFHPPQQAQMPTAPAAAFLLPLPCLRLGSPYYFFFLRCGCMPFCPPLRMSASWPCSSA